MQKTLRDELAMSLDSSHLPSILNLETQKLVCEKLGLDFPGNDVMKMIDFGFAYQAIMRYKYADAMLAVRD